MLIGYAIVVLSLFGAFVGTAVLEMGQGVVVFFIFMHVMGFSISLGPIGCLYVSEIMRDISGVVTLIWALTLVVAMGSDLMIGSLGIGKTFLVFGVVSLVCWGYMWVEMI